MKCVRSPAPRRTSSMLSHPTSKRNKISAHHGIGFLVRPGARLAAQARNCTIGRNLSYNARFFMRAPNSGGPKFSNMETKTLNDEEGVRLRFNQRREYLYDTAKLFSPSRSDSYSSLQQTHCRRCTSIACNAWGTFKPSSWTSESSATLP